MTQTLLSGWRILWLDDNVERIDDHVKTLESCGAIVTTCSDVGEAEALVIREPWDLVIIDTMIPVRRTDTPGYDAATTDRGYATGLGLVRK